LENEGKQIQRMVDSGIIPSSDRIKDYLDECCQNGGAAVDMDKVLSCIADILRLEEEQLRPTEEALRQILVLLESDKPAQEMHNQLRIIPVMAKEPMLVKP
jgi:hypothetical protein